MLRVPNDRLPLLGLPSRAPLASLAGRVFPNQRRWLVLGLAHMNAEEFFTAIGAGVMYLVRKNGLDPVEPMPIADYLSKPDAHLFYAFPRYRDAEARRLSLAPRPRN